MKLAFAMAVENKKPIQIIYLDKNQKLTQRSVTVSSFNEKHLIGYCHQKKKRRIFRIENILAVESKKYRSS